HDPVTQEDLERYAEAEWQLTQMQAPLLLRSDHPHERLYIAALDGTGNSIYKDAPENWSAVGKIYKQIQQSNPEAIKAGYVEGIGTQDGWLANRWDGLTGHTFDQRVETAYFQFCKQAKAWIEEDPDAQIRIAGLGFSRGAELAAALSRVIHERGIMDPTDTDIQYDANGLVTRAEYTRQLAPPGQTLQALVLLDPVATNITEHDRRIPPSVVGAIALMSEDRRDAFKGNRLIPEGMTEGGRFLSLTLPGAHSDLGNSYARDGLGVLSANLAVDYLNSLGERDFLTKQAVPQDPARYVIHRSEEHMPLYSTRGFRDGARDFIAQPGPSGACRVEAQPDCTRKSPVDPALDAQVERRPVRIQPVAGPPRLRPAEPEDPIEAMFMRMTDAALRRDVDGMLRVGREYAQSPEGQAWLQQGRAYNLEQQAAREREIAEALNRQQQQAETPRGPVMRM
ncbi:DUF2235 domain-containing protein, partial [Lysobacter pythonis]